MTEPMIEVRNFRKVYGEHTAVDDISFTVHRGEIFGLLGPSGAGKTSTLEALEGLRPADGGALWDSQNTDRRGHPALALLPFMPYGAWLLLQ